MSNLIIPEGFDLEAAADIKVLVACERFGGVRRAFEALNFDAYSCDLEPDIYRSNRHYTADVRDVLEYEDWDFLAIMHPPCTRLCASGLRWLTGKNGGPPKKLPKGRTLEGLWQELEEGCELFSYCWNADIPCMAVENPNMHYLAKERIKNFQKASQHVQPWWFGEPYFKSTGLYTKKLPKLVPTNKLIPPRKEDEPERHKAWSAIHLAKPGPERAMFRSKTFDGVANAMATQWGLYLVQNIHTLRNPSIAA